MAELISNKSRFFTYNELCVSADYPEIAQKIQLSPFMFSRARLLVDSCLHSIRIVFGVTKILSWVRDEKLNKKVGGSINSDHLLGCAVDFICPNITDNFEIFKYIYKKRMQIRQVIWYEKEKFIHLSINDCLIAFKEEYLIKEKSGNFRAYQ